MLTENVERKNILVNVFAIPYAYGEEDKMRLVDTLHSRGHDFTVYLKNLPHQDLEPGSSLFLIHMQDRLIQWHGLHRASIMTEDVLKR